MLCHYIKKKQTDILKRFGVTELNSNVVPITVLTIPLYSIFSVKTFYISEEINDFFLQGVHFCVCVCMMERGEKN
jgi:hypothetical protein